MEQVCGGVTVNDREQLKRKTWTAELLEVIKETWTWVRGTGNNSWD